MMEFALEPWLVELLKLLIAPLVGALVGALTAQGIARRNAAIQRDLDELRATNSAIGATSAIVASVAALKQQYVRDMKRSYDQLCALRDEAHQRGEVFHFRADLQTLQRIQTPLPMLERLVYEKVSGGPGVLGLFTVVAQAVNGLNEAIEMRNALVRDLKARAPVPPNEMADLYFGLVTEQGDADLNFPDSMEALAHTTDVAILYGCVLGNALASHA